MTQKSMKNFFRKSESEGKKRHISDVSQSTWSDVDELQRAGVQQQPRRVSSSPRDVLDLTIDSSFSEQRASRGSSRGAGRPGGITHSSIAMMVKKESSNADGDADAAVKTEESPNATVNLSSKQNDVLNRIMQGKSVFFTGAAGTGKSHILRVLRRVMEHLGRSDDIAFTAPTGVAACNIRGMTIHSWAGIGLGKESAIDLVKRILRNKSAKKRWENVKILVIDEISMLSAELFDLLHDIASQVRPDQGPFGGIQLILCGDFFQLPPVGLGSTTHLCFQAKSWTDLFGGPEETEPNGVDSGQSLFVLDKVFRQKDSDFLSMLHEVRRGEISESTRKTFTKKVADDYRRERERKMLLSSDERLSQMSASEAASVAAAAFKPTKLFGKNMDVDAVNVAELATIMDTEYTYVAVDEGEEKYLKQLRNGTKFPESITLKIGAQVMLLKNLSTGRGLVNGARGVIVDFEKSQGRSAIFPKVIPVVDFVVYLGDGPAVVERQVLIEESTDIKEGDKVLASRSQLPLMLAYAITIHKSQGMTIPNLEVSFRGIFEYGQAYVALSRATNLTGLILKTFDARAIRAHPEVKRFYQHLGYTGESEHQSTATIATSVLELAEKFLQTCESASSSGGCNHHAIYAHAPPQTSKWITSKRRKASTGRENKAKTQPVSLYDNSSADQQVGTAATEGSTTTHSYSGDNPFAQFGYDSSSVTVEEVEAEDASDPFMERGGRSMAVTPAVKLPMGLEKTLEPFVSAQPPIKFCGREENGSGKEKVGLMPPTLNALNVDAKTKKANITAEQRRKIEANKVAALERMKSIRLKKEEEKEKLMSQFSV